DRMDESSEEFLGLHVLPESTLLSMTDADGRFAFEGLPAEACFTLGIQHASAAVTMVSAATTAKSGVERRDPLSGAKQPVLTGELKIVLKSPHGVMVHVESAEGGAPLSEIMIGAMASGGAGSSAFDTTDDEGNASLNLPPGRYRLMAITDRHPEFVRCEQDL